jgi:hypothetical protein
MKPRVWLALAGLFVVLNASAGQAQPLPKGYLSLFSDYFPNQRDSVELRARLFVEERLEPSKRTVINLSGFAEGLVSRRPAPASPVGLVNVRDAILRVHDANVSWAGERADVLAGYARIAWGKLDEIQPTDVINPIDVSRFFFEGRSEARLPVLLVRARWHVRNDLVVEGVLAPDFRRGRFDRLDEASSPFNLPLAAAGDPAACLAIGCPAGPIAVTDRQPSLTMRNLQGGTRISTTTGRVDWSVSAFRGFEPFGIYRLDRAAAPASAPVVPLSLEYPRFTMIGADFEAVRGKWGMRGEAAAFTEDNFQSADLRVVSGRSFDAGAGIDRRAGDYTLSATVLVHAERYDLPLSQADPRDGRTDVSLVASADRTFAREKYRLRTFAVYNATEQSGFLRTIGMANVRDNLALEASIGWFAGSGDSLIGRFGDSDFLYARLKYYF